MNNMEYVSKNGKVSKVDRYKWTNQDTPGDFRWLNKHDLNVDHSYQRDANETKLLKITGSWSWVACGAIVVCDRGDEGFFVIDGQHRVMAAIRRVDIVELPCIVFAGLSIKREALGFLEAQTKRKPVTAIEKFRALIMTENADALLVLDLIKISGRTVGSGSSPETIRCVGCLLDWAKNDPSTLCDVWPLVIEISTGHVISERIVEGLIYIAKRMPDGTSLTDAYWKKRFIKVGVKDLIKATADAANFYSKGGAKVWALGMVQAVNKGHRNLLEIKK